MQSTKNQQKSNPIIKSFSNLKDPRRTTKGNLCYPLVEIVFLVISAVISGANDWTSIATFGEEQLDWLRKFFPYKNGTPSHDTLGTIFSMIDNEQFGNCFIEWINAVVDIYNEEIIAIDGKKMRGSYDTKSSKAAIHMVSAFGVENGICLGQVTTDKKSNEITAIPKLLELLEIKGCIITIDAMGCQKKIVENIVENEADYVVAVKQNQKELSEQVKKMFSIDKGTTQESIEVNHGRVENRKCTVIDDLKFFDVKDDWAGIKSVIKIEAERFDKLHKTTQKEIRYYISSLIATPERFNYIIRNHWNIENKLHWVLDVNFNEDKSRKRKGDSPSNFNMIAKIAMTMLKNDENNKDSITQKRYRATLSSKYREKLLKV